MITILGIELPFFQRLLDTVSLTGSQWLAVLGLSLVVPVLVEAEKAYRRHRSAT